MRIDYDSEGRTLQIDLEPVGVIDYGDEVHGRAVVGIREGRPVRVDVTGIEGLDETLAAVASAYGLDAGVLTAAARAALAVPDRAVEIDVHTRAAV